MKRIGKRLVGTCVSIMLISSFFVSCGRKDNTQAGMKADIETNIEADTEADIEADVEAGSTLERFEKIKEESEDNDKNMIDVVNEQVQVPLQESTGKITDDSSTELDEAKQPIRDGEELEIIRAQYQQDKALGNQGSLFAYPEYLIEIDIPDLYVKTQMKAYQAFTLIDNPAGKYLLYHKTALPVLDSLEEISIADIDQDGEYELLSLFGFGSGIYRINLNVYQATNPIFFSSTMKIPMLRYQNCFIPKAGFAKLVFDQVSDSEVHLREYNLKTDQMGQDYGKLVIHPETGRITLENLEEFPYDVWGDVYNQDNWDTQGYDDESLTTVPELKVSVGNVIVPNVSMKKDWNGEIDETLDFTDAITEEIPQFIAPSGLYKYDQEIKLEFAKVDPTSIKISDILITKEGQPIYSLRESLERPVRKGDDGAYYLGLENHFALHLSSNTASYTNPSYRGFRVLCEFGENHICEYIFVLSLGPIWKESKN